MKCPICRSENEMLFSVLSLSFICQDAHCGIELAVDLRDAEVEFAKIENGVLVKNDKGQLQFAPAEQIKLNKVTDKISDAYVESVEKFGEETVEYYVPVQKVKQLPSTLSAEVKKSLLILIEE